MNSKDEIEKLINVEQAKLEDLETKHVDYRQRQRDRFAPLRIILEEISASIDSKYLESRIDDYSAKITLGRIEKSYRSTDTSWRIEPNHGTNFQPKAGEILFYEEPGFIVEEYNSHIDDSSEKTEILLDEQAVSEYLIKKITEQVAQYRHLKSLAEKRKKDN